MLLVRSRDVHWRRQSQHQGRPLHLASTTLAIDDAIPLTGAQFSRRGLNPNTVQLIGMIL